MRITLNLILRSYGRAVDMDLRRPKHALALLIPMLIDRAWEAEGGL